MGPLVGVGLEVLATGSSFTFCGNRLKGTAPSTKREFYLLRRWSYFAGRLLGGSSGAGTGEKTVRKGNAARERARTESRRRKGHGNPLLSVLSTLGIGIHLTLENSSNLFSFVSHSYKALHHRATVFPVCSGLPSFNLLENG
jgi:hypothetical protein